MPVLATRQPLANDSAMASPRRAARLSTPWWGAEMATEPENQSLSDARSCRRPARSSLPRAEVYARDASRPASTRQAPRAIYRFCQRSTVRLHLPTARTTAILPSRSADNSTIRDRQTNFCGVLRSATQPSSVARSSGESQMHACVFMPADSHRFSDLGILC